MVDSIPNIQKKKDLGKSGCTEKQALVEKTAHFKSITRRDEFQVKGELSQRNSL
jgi:hypothetical protein